MTNLSIRAIFISGERPEYFVEITINGRKLKRVIIDQHYRIAHSESVNDEIILELVRTLSGINIAQDTTHGNFEYFTQEPVYRLKKPYRLIFFISKVDDFLGVVNAFRINE